MSSDVVIKAERLSKKYIIGHEDQIARGETFRDVISRTARSLARTGRDMLHGRAIVSGDSTEEFWALKDINFEVKSGEVTGIIGRNGAGKSTLLKILSRITEPTEGRVTIKGRVASLLEVGTGFHPELSGRENIFLNGAILGMTRAEIKRKFDEIVAFAEVEKFLDTPVKRYSSGMYVRLAFAVAAHLEPEILIVDEVLAVGDAEFQRKCLGKMDEVAGKGRTIIFVSHNMTAVEELCSNVVILDRGKIQSVGTAHATVSEYLRSIPGRSEFVFDTITDREGSGNARITSVELLTADKKSPLSAIAFYQPFCVRIHYCAKQRLLAPKFGLAVLSDRGERIVLNENTEGAVTIEAIEGIGFIDCIITNPCLVPGEYCLELWIVEIVNVLFADHLKQVATFRVVATGDNSRASSATLSIPGRGPVYFDCAWSQPQFLETLC